MFEKFSVIDLIKTRSASVCTFAGNVVKFNVQTAQELRFPEYIQFLIEPKSKQFAIRACKEDAPNAVRFSKPEGEQKAQIKISNATVVDMVRKLMDWNAEDNWNVPGIYFAEEQGIMYALESAYAPRAKGGWAARREREAAAALAESSIDNEEVNKLRLLRKFCVSEFRQNQEFHVINVHDDGLFPLATTLPIERDGMRAARGVNAVALYRES